MPALQSSALGSGPSADESDSAPHADPTKCRASGRQPPLTRGRRPLAAKGSSERAESRCLRARVPMGGTRGRERPCHAASSVPHCPRHQMPPQGRQPPLLHAAGALSRQKGRASGRAESRCLRTRVPMGGTRGRESLHNLRALLRCTLHFYNTSTHASVSTQKSNKDTRGRAESLLFSPPLSLLSCGLIGLPALAPSSRRWTWQASSRTDWRCRQRPQHRV